MRKFLNVFIVVIFLSTFILAMVSWILYGETPLLLVAVELLMRALEFSKILIELKQMNYL